MAKILVVYGTKEGQTEKISKIIAEDLKDLGHLTTFRNVESISNELNIREFDGVIVGAPVHIQKFPSQLVKWVHANSTELNLKPTAFFSVCLGILQRSDEKTQVAERAIVESFLKATQWRPTQWTIFAGALMYSKYGWLKKLMMKRIARKAGGGTDTSRDYEYTDWDEVRSFSDHFASGFSNQASINA